MERVARYASVLLASLLWSTAGLAAPACPEMEQFLTGKAVYPVERTLLTSGVLAAAVQSLGTGQRRLETPHLAVRYQGPKESTFVRS